MYEKVLLDQMSVTTLRFLSLQRLLTSFAKMKTLQISTQTDDKKHKMQTYSLQDIHLTFSSERFKIPK